MEYLFMLLNRTLTQPDPRPRPRRWANKVRPDPLFHQPALLRGAFGDVLMDEDDSLLASHDTKPGKKFWQIFSYFRLKNFKWKRNAVHVETEFCFLDEDKKRFIEAWLQGISESMSVLPPPDMEFPDLATIISDDAMAVPL